MNPADHELWITPARRPIATLILAHGAGAGSDSEFLRTIAEGLARQRVTVVRFDFPYMCQMRTTGRRRPPNPAGVLTKTWHEVVDKVRRSRRKRPLWIGGKSMGGRIASLVAEEVSAAGLVCLGYPFHPPGARDPKPARTAHLAEFDVPALIVQGERDRFGTREQVAKYPLSPRIEIEWLPDGDHDLKPRRNSGLTKDMNWQAAIDAAARFIRTHSHS